MILPRSAVLSLCLSACLISGACGDLSTSESDDGSVRRVVSLNPSFTEIIAALGRSDRLVGRTRWCTYPAEVLAVPVVGDAFAPDAEALVAARPDLVLVQSRILLESLRPLEDRFRIRFVPNDSPAEVIASIEAIGKELDAVDEAARLIATIKAEIAKVEARTARGTRRPRVLCIVNRDPYFVVARDSYVGQLIEIAGGEVATADDGESYPKLSLEAIVALRPDVIIDATPGNEGGEPADDSKALAYWRAAAPGVPAVVAERVHSVGEAHLFRPGPRLPLALKFLAEVLAR